MIKTTENVSSDGTNLLDEKKKYFDAISLFFFTALFFVDFIPDFDIVAYTPPIHYIYLSILNILMGIFIYLNPVLLSTSLLLKVKKSVFLKFYFLFLILCVLSLFFARNIPLSSVDSNYLIISLLTIMNFSILFNNRMHLIYRITFIIVVICFIEVFIALIDFLKLYKIDPYSAYKISLNTGNINIFAASLNLKLPFVLLGIYTFSNWKKWLSIAAFLGSCVILFLNNNKAAFLSLTLIVLIFLIYQAIFNKKYKKIGLILICVAFTIGISYLLINTSKTSPEVVTTTLENKSLLQTIDNEGSASVRFSFWKNALHLAKENLFTGVGLGNYPVEITPYDNKSLNDGHLTIHPHNDFIEIIVETGIINGLIYILLFVTIFIINLKRIKSGNSETKIIALITLLMLLVYGVDAFLNFPLYQPTIQISFCLILVFTLLNKSISEEKNKSFVSKKYILPIILIGFITLFVNYTILKTYKLELEIRNDFALEKHQITAQYIADNLPKYPNINNETYSFYQKLGVYYYFENNYSESKKAFKKSKEINPFSGVEEWYLSKIYQKTDVDSSQFYINKSFELRPRDGSTYLDALYISNLRKDTLEILKTNAVFSSYRNAPVNYIHTSNALYNSGYNIKKLNEFIDEGLQKFPGDSLLVDRKMMFQKVIDAKKGVVNSEKTAIQPIKNDNTTPAENKINNIVSINLYLQNAINYASKKQYDLAIKNYLLVLEKYPDNLAIHQNIGICKFEQKKFNEAIPYLEKSLKDPKLNDGKSQYLLGISYLNIKKKEQGCSFLNTAKAKNYPNAAQLIDQYCK